MIVLTSLVAEESHNPDAGRLRSMGICDLYRSLLLLTLALISGNHLGWSSFTILTELLRRYYCLFYLSPLSFASSTQCLIYIF